MERGREAKVQVDRSPPLLRHVRLMEVLLRRMHIHWLLLWSERERARASWALDEAAPGTKRKPSCPVAQ